MLDEKLTFQFMPKLFRQFEIRALCKLPEFLHTKLARIDGRYSSEDTVMLEQEKASDCFHRKHSRGSSHYTIPDPRGT